MVYETAAGIFIRDDKVLLGKRPKDKKCYPGMWDVPAGHLEHGESPVEALFREIKEEVNVDVVRYFPVLVYEEKDAASGRDYRHHCFLVLEWKGEITQFNEMESFGWFTLEETKNMRITFRHGDLEKAFDVATTL